VVGRRLPILVMTGPAADLKAQLANFVLKSLAVSYAVVSESAIGASIAGSDQPAQNVKTFTVDGCLCCIGAVTLMAQLTRLLRAQRRENKYQGILLVAGAQTNSAVLIDLLRQPLLAELVEVSTVIYICSKVLLADAEEVACADVVFFGQKCPADLRLTPEMWFTELPGSEDRVFTSDIAHLQDLAVPKSTTINKVVWPAENVFDRQKLQNIFDQAVKDGLHFDAVFRTQRAWYRWALLNNTRPNAPMLETAYRRQSYLHWCPTEGSQMAFNALKLAIESQGISRLGL
jgi:hypothetical protein